MNKIYYILLILLISSCSIKESVKKDRGNNNDLINRSERNFSTEDMALLTSRSIVFFFKENDTEHRAEIETAIKKVWDYTPIEFAYFSERNNYPSDMYAYFAIEGHTSSSSLHLYLTLTVQYQVENNRGIKKDKSINYCRLDIMPKQLMFKNDGKSKSFLEMIYNNAEMNNWNASMLQTYLIDVQQHLKKNYRAFVYEEFANEEHLDYLKDDTLFIPEYTLERRLMATGKMHDTEKMLKDYPYNYKVVTLAELNERIMKSKETYVFEYIVSSTDKFVRIYSTQAGKVYQDYSHSSWGLKAKDFKNIYK
jgi:hypothetical protein